MTMQEITIRVAPEAAAIYLAASEPQRKKLDTLLSLRLSVAGTETRPLQEVIHEASKEAHANGMTPEVLREILDGACTAASYRPGNNSRITSALLRRRRFTTQPSVDAKRRTPGRADRTRSFTLKALKKHRPATSV